MDEIRPVAPEVAARFATLLDSKRGMLMALARQARENVEGARRRGDAITEDLLVQEEYSRRLESAAEALGSSELPVREAREVKVPKKSKKAA